MNKKIRKIAEESGVFFGKDNNGEYCDFYGHRQSIPALEEFTKRLLDEYIMFILNDESGDIDYIKWKIRKEMLENGN